MVEPGAIYRLCVSMCLCVCLYECWKRCRETALYKPVSFDILYLTILFLKGNGEWCLKRYIKAPT